MHSLDGILGDAREDLTQVGSEGPPVDLLRKWASRGIDPLKLLKNNDFNYGLK